MVRGTGAILCMCVLLAVSGCAAANSGTTTSTTRTFELAAINAVPASAAADGGASSAQVVVSEPTATRALDSENVVVRFSNAEIGQLQNAVWSDRLPKLLQTRLVQALQNVARFRAVSDGRDKISADLLVTTEIQAFQIEIAKPSDIARIELRVKLVNSKTGHVIATRNFSASKTVGGKSVSDNVNALNEAFLQSASDVVGWVVELGPKRTRKRRA